MSVSFTPGSQGSGTFVNLHRELRWHHSNRECLPITVTGLTNGTTYTCKVATNHVGRDEWLVR